MRITIKLDYTLESAEERKALVEQILKEFAEENPDKLYPTDSYLEILANYMLIPVDREERRQRKLLTENRMTTINKRETSLEGLVSQLENGEDGIYNLAVSPESNKHTIFQPKVSITKKDLEDIPELVKIREAIKHWEELLKTATGKRAYIIKKTIIDLRKDQYVVKEAYRKPVGAKNIVHSRHLFIMNDSFTFDEEGYVVPSGFSLCDPKVISAVLCNYTKLKQSGVGDPESDLWYFMVDFDDTMRRALAAEPLYRSIVQDKIDGYQNIEIQENLQKRFGTTHSLEYISSLWRKKIPALIASQAEDDLLDWYYLTQEKGKYKKCSRCGQIKLAHNKYFSKNKTSKDGFYSICKECRNKKAKGE